MKIYFKITLAVLIFFTISGCNSNTVSHALSNAVDNALVATSGNKPPKFFAFASPDRANGYVMQHKDYSFTMPLTKSSDWNKMSGWTGAYIYGGIGIGIDNLNTKTYGAVLSYGVNFYSSISKYTEDTKQYELFNEKYFQEKYPLHKLKNGRIVGINRHLERHGKENYTCEVSEMKEIKRGISEKSYECYKFNPSRTKVKRVGITLVYTKSPNLPPKYKNLAKEYTYQDLKNRAKRMLDSLYIKDGW